MSTSEIVVQDHERPPERGALRGGGGGGSPRFGCILLALLGAFFVGIVINFVVSGIRHYDTLAKFTDEEPIEIPEERGTEAEVQAIRAKVAAFRKGATGGGPVDLSLTAKDMNVLIANDAYLADIRGTVYFEGIGDDGVITARISRPMAKILFWKPRRYLNGEMTLKVEAAPGRVFLRVVDVKPPAGQFDPKILDFWKTQDQLEPYKNDESFAEILEKIQAASPGGGAITFTTKKQKPPEEGSPEASTPSKKPSDPPPPEP